METGAPISWTDRKAHAGAQLPYALLQMVVGLGVGPDGYIRVQLRAQLDLVAILVPRLDVIRLRARLPVGGTMPLVNKLLSVQRPASAVGIFRGMKFTNTDSRRE